MKTAYRYGGGLPALIHSPAGFVFTGKPATVSAAFRAYLGNVPDRLVLKVRGEEIAMLPSDGYSVGKTEYEIYSCEIPQSALIPGRLTYSIGTGDRFSDYSVEVVDRASLPAEPPLILTEIYARPRGRSIGQYLELMNPSDRPVDLYDYEVIIFRSKEPEGKPACRLPLSDAPGKDILAPGEVAAVWGVKTKNFGKDGRDWTSAADFFDDFNDGYGREDSPLAYDAGRVIPVKLFTEDPLSGKRIPLPEAGEIPIKLDVSRLCIVPRGRDADEEIYHAVYSEIYGEMDTPVWHSSHWRTDIRRPDTGIVISRFDDPTPGFARSGQIKHDPDSAVPVIIPVYPDGAVYIGDGELSVRFAAVGAGVPDETLVASVSVIGSDGSRETLDASLRDDGLFYAVIPREFLERQRALTFVLSVFDGTREASFPADGQDPFTVPVLDNAGPRVLSILPTEGYAFDGRGKIVISASYYDVSGVDISSCELRVDGRNRTKEAEWTEKGVRLETVLQTGGHTLSLTLYDTVSNVSKTVVSFSVSDMKELNFYVGEVHAHTSHSDGTGLPEDAVKYARDVGKVDFFSVTEHSHYLNRKKYASQLATANKYDEPGKFACLYGWEMTWNNKTGYWGHMNVLGSREVVRNIEENDMPALYAWLDAHPEAVAMFNHPGYTWGNFEEFAYHTDKTDRAVRLSEIKGPVYDYQYMHLLSRGWHASPVSSEDNHAPNWTTATKMTGVVLAPALTRENVLDAFRSNRTYTSSDRSMRISYRVNGEWLGSHLSDPDELKFDISITTENKRGISLVEIVAEDDIVVASKNAGACREICWKPVLSPDYDYYYLRVTGPGQYCVTSPVWVDNRRAPAIAAMKCYPTSDEKDSVCCTVSVECPEDEPQKRVRVAFFLSPADVLKRYETEPFRVVWGGSIEPGERLNVTAMLPEIPGMRRITAEVSAISGKKRRRSTAFVLHAPLSVTEVLFDSEPLEKDGETYADPFPYVNIYNSSPLDVSLAGGRIGFWTDTGKPAKPEHTFPTDGITVPAKSCVVVWDRRDPGLTVADFNARYGTGLAEGRDIFISSVRITDSAKEGRRIELYAEGDLMNRVSWHCCSDFGTPDVPGKAAVFEYRPNATLSSEFCGFAAPRPGRVDPGRVPPEKNVVPSKRDEKRRARETRREDREAQRKQKTVLTAKEGAAIAAAAAAVGLTAALVKKKKK